MCDKERLELDLEETFYLFTTMTLTTNKDWKSKYFHLTPFSLPSFPFPR